MLLSLLIVTVLAIVIGGIYLRFSKAGRQIAEIPGPKGLPILGNALTILMEPDELFKFIRRINRENKTICQISAVNLRVVNIYEPDYAEAVLSTTRFNDKIKPYSFLKPWLNEGLLISNGSKWQQRRKLLTPAFHFNILKKYTRTFTEQTENFIENVKEEIGKDKTSLQPLISKATLHIMLETAMGTSMNAGIDAAARKYFEAIYIVGECIINRITRIWYLFDFTFNLSSIARALHASIKDLHKFTNHVIQERRTFLETNQVTEFNDDSEVYGKKGRLAMLDLLLQNEKEGKIDVNGIREEVDTFMFEGHDTTAMALTYMTMRIANEREVQKKICEELDRVFGGSDRLPTMEDLNELKYLECCIKESLRLYPSVPVITRHATEDLKLGKYTVPQGATFHVHIFDIHRRPDIYPEPEKFIPERFLPENSAKRHAYAYIPFSAGPRNCIGQKFAMLEMKTMMSRLLRKYQLEPVTKPEDVVFVTDLVLRTKYPIYVRFVNKKELIVEN